MKFEMKDLRNENCEKQGNQDIVSFAKKYSEKLLVRFNMNDAKAVTMPLAQHLKLSTCDLSKIEQEIMYIN